MYLKTTLSKHNWPMRSSELLTLLGLKPTSPIPSDFECVKAVIDGDGHYNYVKVLKADQGKHRVLVECSTCKELYPAGRIRQHAVVHK